jgi:hypothetical protein
MAEDDFGLRRSGFKEWAYDYVLDHLITWPLALVAFVGNLLTHMLVFRGVQRALVAKLPPPEPGEPRQAAYPRWKPAATLVRVNATAFGSGGR